MQEKCPRSRRCESSSSSNTKKSALCSRSYYISSWIHPRSDGKWLSKRAGRDLGFAVGAGSVIGGCLISDSRFGVTMVKDRVTSGVEVTFITSRGRRRITVHQTCLTTGGKALGPCASWEKGTPSTPFPGKIQDSTSLRYGSSEPSIRGLAHQLEGDQVLDQGPYLWGWNGGLGKSCRRPRLKSQKGGLTIGLGVSPGRGSRVQRKMHVYSRYFWRQIERGRGDSRPKGWKTAVRT